MFEIGTVKNLEVCVCVLHTCSHVCVHVFLEARGQPWLQFLGCFSPCVQRHRLSLVWSLPSRLGQIASEPQGSAWLLLSSAGIVNTHSYAWLLLLLNMNAGELNPGPHACKQAFYQLRCLPSSDLEIFTTKKKIQERKLIAVILISRKQQLGNQIRMILSSDLYIWTVWAILSLALGSASVEPEQQGPEQRKQTVAESADHRLQMGASQGVLEFQSMLVFPPIQRAEAGKGQKSWEKMRGVG